MTLTADLVPAAEQRARRRSRIGWTALIAAFIVVGVALTFATVRQWSAPSALAADSPAADGALALTRLLEEHGGITVTPADTIDEAERLVDADTTLAIGNASGLSDDDLEDLVSSAGDTVLIAPTSRDLRVLFDGASFADYASGTVHAASCDVDAAVAAGSIAPGQLFTPGTGNAACFPSGAGYALLQTRTADDGTVTAVDGSSTLVNSALAEAGNAALWLGLLGAHDDVVWYLPTDTAAAADGTKTIGDLTPGWVTPVILLCGLAAAACGVWRGRRFGPLVAESLPVTVRASETLDGRARLYARSRDTAHAAGLLRTGALRRLAMRLGAPRAASAVEIADAAAARLGVPNQTTRDILLAEPHDDASLVRFTERLRELEAAVDAAVHDERTTP